MAIVRVRLASGEVVDVPLRVIGNKGQDSSGTSGSEGTIAKSARQTVVGEYNVADDEGKYAFIVGNGASDEARSNAFAVTWDGTMVVGGVEITPEQLTKLLDLIK